VHPTIQETEKTGKNGGESLMPETPDGKTDAQQDDEDGNKVRPDQWCSPYYPDSK